MGHQCVRTLQALSPRALLFKGSSLLPPCPRLSDASPESHHGVSGCCWLRQDFSQASAGRGTGTSRTGRADPVGGGWPHAAGRGGK